jgi:glutamine amidotransferase
MSVVVVDSSVANLTSVMAGLDRLGAKAETTADARKICKADHVILPGVGAATAAMSQLQDKGLIDTLRRLSQPVLGICLGMQLLFANSEESGDTPLLGIIPGTIKLLRSSPETPVPHMGWNQLELRSSRHSLLQGINNNDYVYFVHSYAAPVMGATLAVTTYGEAFTSIIEHKNFLGCQFHPERSSAVGSRILKNFLSL